MNSFLTTATYPEATISSGRKSKAARASGPKVRFNGIAAISLVSIVLALATASECHSIFYPPSLLYGFMLWGWWGCIASVIWKLGPKSSLVLSSSPQAFAVNLLLACALGFAHLLLLGSLGFTSTDWAKHSSALAVWASLLQINRFGIELLIYGFVVGITGIAFFQIRAQRDAMKALELEKQLSAAHLRALQMQLEPHFLFNTLNAITTLVELDRQKDAAEMLGHLISILKTTLKRTTPEKVPLSQELEMVENYLAIEQVRFADRLRIEIAVQPDALDALVPCFLLQPIVENAIRHGIAHCESEGKVEASARCEAGKLHLRIRDSGSGLRGHAKAGHGIGLTNTQERLAHFYHNAYNMQARTLDAGGFEVAITIPYECG
jgi:hypothetical protein